MKPAWMIWPLLLCCALRAEDDPFAAAAEKSEGSPGEFMAFSGHEVTPVTPWYPEAVKPELWPEVKLPTKFNRSFEKPTTIWQAPGGYFASFDRGEFLMGFDVDGTSHFLGRKPMVVDDAKDMPAPAPDAPAPVKE